MLFRRSVPYGEMFDMLRDVDHLFRSTLAGPRLLPADLTSWRAMPAPAQSEAFTPAVECFTRDNQLVLRAELPGVEPAQVEVSVTGRTLTIRGEKKQAHESTEGDVHFREVSHGQFERSFTLPEGVKSEEVKATFTDGVLEISLPAVGVESTRRIPIQGAAEGSRKAIKAA